MIYGNLLIPKCSLILNSMGVWWVYCFVNKIGTCQATHIWFVWLRPEDNYASWIWENGMGKAPRSLWQQNMQFITSKHNSTCHHQCSFTPPAIPPQIRASQCRRWPWALCYVIQLWIFNGRDHLVGGTSAMSTDSFAPWEMEVHFGSFWQLSKFFINVH